MRKMSDDLRIKEVESLLDRYYKSEDSFEQTELAISIIQGHVGHLLNGFKQSKNYRKAIKECVERMNEGGTGTRSFVYERLIKVLEGEK